MLAITGASGAIYAVRLLEVLLAAGQQVHLSISPSARAGAQAGAGTGRSTWHSFRPNESAAVAPTRRRRDVAAGDGRGARGAAQSTAARGQIVYHHYENLMAPIASGSFLTAGMVICPCSGSTLGAVVHGTGENLIHRAAGVHLKERRKLILVPRETPLSTIQLDNMRRAAEAGAVVLPAMPGFYHGVESIRRPGRFRRGADLRSAGRRELADAALGKLIDGHPRKRQREVPCWRTCVTFWR